MLARTIRAYGVQWVLRAIQHLPEFVATLQLL
jgi:hypothetical protein